MRHLVKWFPKRRAPLDPYNPAHVPTGANIEASDIVTFRSINAPRTHGPSVRERVVRLGDRVAGWVGLGWANIQASEFVASFININRFPLFPPWPPLDDASR